MPSVQCPFCSAVLASAMTEQRARELAVLAKADHLCGVAPAESETPWLSETFSKPSSATGA